MFHTLCKESRKPEADLLAQENQESLSQKWDSLTNLRFPSRYFSNKSLHLAVKRQAVFSLQLIDRVLVFMIILIPSPRSKEAIIVEEL